MEKPDNEPLPYIGRLDVIRQVAAQVAKDFEMFGHEIVFTGRGDQAYTELFNQILPIIDKLQLSDSRKLLGMLYRIDLSEEQVRQVLRQQGTDAFPSALTDLILKRELQKVVLRMAYKGH
jgi:hypothetical protein